MADSEHYSGRRGSHTRGRSGYSRVYHHLGVRDLREIIDRKRNERGQTSDSHVPPDPSYNYLKDPLRENTENTQETSKQTNSRKFKHNTYENKWKKDKEHHDPHTATQGKDRDIENPLNIKVEFSTSTGEHVYTVDENTVLPTIKHVPDHITPHNRSFRSRGRGRGRGPRNYQTRTIRSSRQNPSSAGFQDTVLKQDQPVSVTSDENWDDELNQSGETIKHQVEPGQSDEVNEVDEQLLYEEIEESPNPEVEQGDLEKQVENLKIDGDENSSKTNKADK